MDRELMHRDMVRQLSCLAFVILFVAGLKLLEWIGDR